MAGYSSYEVEAANIARKQKIAEAMTASSLQPMQLPTQPGAKAHWSSALAKLVEAYAGSKGAESSKEAQLALGERYSNDLRSGVEAYDKTSRGHTTAGDTPLPADVAGPVRGPETIPGDPRKAVFEALSSGHPVLQDLAMRQLTEQSKGQLTPKDLAPYANPKLMMANPNDPSKWGSKSNVGEVGGTLYDKDNLQTLKLSGAAPTEETIGGDLYQRSPSTGVLTKKDNAPKVTTNVNTGMPGNKFATELEKERASTLTKSFEATRGIPASMGVLDEASANLSQGIKSGQLADINLALAKTAKAFGLGDVNPEIANTEAFRANMAGSVLEVLKTLRPASDKDVQYAEKAAGGTITLDDKTMLRLIDSARAAGLNKLIDHDNLLTRNKGASGASENDLATFEVPFSVSDPSGNLEYRNGRFSPKIGGNAPKAAAKLGTAENPMSYDEYMKLQKGGR